MYVVAANYRDSIFYFSDNRKISSRVKLFLTLFILRQRKMSIISNCLCNKT